MIGRSDSALSGMSVSRSRTGTRPDLGPPHRRIQIAPGHLHGYGEWLAGRVQDTQDRQLGQVVVGVGVLLVPVRVDGLAEVAALVQQTHAHERHRHVAGGLDVIARQDAQAAGVDAEALVEAVLGAEVGDGAAQRRAVLAVEPVLTAAGHVTVEGRQDLRVFGLERRVVEQLVPGDRLREDLDRIAVARPRESVDSAEEGPSPRVPAPPHVVGEAPQPLELRRQPERGAGEGGDLDREFHARASYPRDSASRRVGARRAIATATPPIPECPPARL